MKITKYGHCCVLIECRNTRILTDPGAFSEGFNELRNIDLVLITHEHGDHLHTDSLKEVLQHNPQARVVCNSSVSKILTNLSVPHTILEGSASATVGEMKLKAYDGEHAEIVGNYGLVQNTGYLLDGGTFFYPGDAYTVPDEAINVLALPVAGPWCKVAEAIAYGVAVKPKTAIPVHDALLNAAGKSVTYPHFARELTAYGIEFVTLKNKASLER